MATFLASLFFIFVSPSSSSSSGRPTGLPPLSICRLLHLPLLLPLAISCPDCAPLSSQPLLPTPLLSFLQDLQAAALASLGPAHFDTKDIIDLPLRFPLSQTSVAFQKLERLPSGSIPLGTFQKFVSDYFYPAGSDLEAYTPPDFVSQPEDFLPNVKNHQVREWALQVHSLWLNLSVKVAPSVAQHPDRHTLLPLPHPAIIPGSRFREVYYWDSYWIIKGLIVSKMFETAKGVIENLMSFVDTYGFVLNGARAYYENRSQPPLLSAMVREVYAATNDLGLLKKALPVLIREHAYWTSEPHQVTIMDRNGLNHSLSRYSANWDNPRPESFTTDTRVASGVSHCKKPFLYHDIASTAESGWDFSSRWMGDRQNLTTLHTSLYLPTDLNAYLLQMEENIGFIAMTIGNTTIAEQFSSASKSRKFAIDAILWSEDMGQWLDYILQPDMCASNQRAFIWKEHGQNRDIFASNFIPLWCNALSPGDSRVDKVIDAFEHSGLLHVAGIATSLHDSSQQWDFPNAWAPLQHMIIESFDKLGSKRGKALARTIVQRWLRTNFATFAKIGKMEEKYDVRACGAIGSGGEYVVQTGLGWTNGVVLALLHDFGWPQDMHIDC